MPQKKKILYVITKSNFGGAQRYVYDLATSLDTSEYDVSVACGGKGVLVQKLSDRHIETFQLQYAQRDINPFKEILFFFELYKLMKDEKPDVVHLNSSKAGTIGACAARVARIKKIIFTVHGWPFLERRNVVWKSIAWIGSWFSVLLSDATILVSEHDLKYDHMPIVRRKLSVIHNGVNEAIYEERLHVRTMIAREKNIPEYINDVWIATTAELHPNKNIYTALDAVIAHNRKSQTKIRYFIFGDGELQNEVTKYIEKNKVSAIVYGFLPSYEKYLKAFDVFLLPSHKEGLPYVLLDAGCAELPVVASRVGGIPEIIEDGKNGLLIDPNDPSTITRAITKLAENPDLRTRFGTALKEKVTREFTLQNMLEKTYALY